MRYKAFISYSRADRAFAVTLQRSLERYNVPKESRADPISRRVGAIFRDENELVPGGDLPTRLSDALSQSEYLIVVCSPNAAGSIWVDEEVSQFLAQSSLRKLLCVVVGGAPNTGGDDECLPHPLRRDVLGAEALWVDARDARNARMNQLRILAMLLGLNSVDDLARRDAAHRCRLQFGWTVAAVISVALLLAGVAAPLLVQRDNAFRQASTLVELARRRSEEGDFQGAARFALLAHARTQGRLLAFETTSIDAELRHVILSSPLQRASIDVEGAVVAAFLDTEQLLIIDQDRGRIWDDGRIVAETALTDCEVRALVVRALHAVVACATDVALIGIGDGAIDIISRTSWPGAAPDTPIYLGFDEVSGRTILTAGVDAYSWRFDGAALSREYRTQSFPYELFALSPSGARALQADWDAILEVDPESGARSGAFNINAPPSSWASFSADEGSVALITSVPDVPGALTGWRRGVGGDWGDEVRFDGNRFEALGRPEMSADGQFVATTWRDPMSPERGQRGMVWSADGRLAAATPAQPRAVHAVHLSPSRRQLALIGEDAVQVWSLPIGGSLHQAWMPGSGSAPRLAQLYERASAAAGEALAPDAEFEVSSTGGSALVGIDAARVRWVADGGNFQQDIAVSLRDASLSRDGAYLAYAEGREVVVLGRDGQRRTFTAPVAIMDTPVVRFDHRANVVHLAWPLGMPNYLTTSYAVQSIDLGAEVAIGPISVPVANVRNVALSPDRKFLAVESVEGVEGEGQRSRIQIVDIASGRPVGAAISSMEFVRVYWDDDGDLRGEPMEGDVQRFPMPPGLRLSAREIVRTICSDLLNGASSTLTNEDFNAAPFLDRDRDASVCAPRAWVPRL